MSRSKLDEIVCEVMRFDKSYAYTQSEGNSVFPINGIQLGEIAERAFRHGVEQSVEATKVLQGHRFDLNGLGLAQILALGAEAAQKQIRDVQPAPAGEKCPDCRHGTACPTCGKMSLCFCHPDRRKGERRSLLNPTSYVALPPGGLTRVYKWRENVEPWLPDRRSGKDRRK